ncbi:DUF1987 domain-containing protein [Paenibacillus sp.]|uniref:DUF1987 domain-containing protein n=1 Tax=Paenibacillus sp. TaxID=58172 RepID=UPI002D38F3FF|nr:DUF1987 domain-containing protein [Paenibacillus sp.]HZG84348.1 DUF1987 domain-containing protein [Paenibacillus sp.]
MKTLQVEPTKSTPEVRFDPDAGVLSITGQSYPENAFKFYEPLLSWLDEYLEQVTSETTVSIELHLPYINTSSTKCFMMMLEKLNDAFLAGKQVKVLWFYNEDNETELECAEEFKEDLSLPFDIVPKGDPA